MSKRFTDAKKWRSSWFRKLPIKAKLVWGYLCDECGAEGLMKIDYELANFQLGFSIDPQTLSEWFREKLYFFSEEKFLIVPFFNFQYGESKDSWSAKVQAKKKIELLGFTIENNEVIIPERTQSPHGDPTVGVESKTILSIGIVKGTGIVDIKGGLGEKEIRTQAEIIYKKHYPRKVGRSDGLDKASKDLKTEQDLVDFESAIVRYATDCATKKTEAKYIKHFSTFVSTWRDWLEPDAGDGPKAKNYENETGTDHDAEMREMWGSNG
ncbi:MAG: hypothetical protein AAGB31_08775 [Bdellovibrio sp.]